MGLDCAGEYTKGGPKGEPPMSVIESISLPAMSTGGAVPITKYDREYAAFRRMLPTLLQTHLGQYVAIHDGQIVASGSERLPVVVKAFAIAGNVAIHVDYVGTEPAPISRSGVRRDLSNHR